MTYGSSVVKATDALKALINCMLPEKSFESGKLNQITVNENICLEANISEKLGVVTDNFCNKKFLLEKVLCNLQSKFLNSANLSIIF